MFLPIHLFFLKKKKKAKCWVIGRCQGGGGGKMSEGSRKVKISGYKVNKSWACHVKHGDCSSYCIAHLKAAESIDLASSSLKEGVCRNVQRRAWYQAAVHTNVRSACVHLKLTPCCMSVTPRLKNHVDSFICKVALLL